MQRNNEESLKREDRDLSNLQEKLKSGRSQQEQSRFFDQV